MFIFFGLIAVVASYYLQAGETHLSAWILGCAIGFLNAAIMLANNTRDMLTDTKAGKRTLAVRVGEGQARLLYQTFVFLPFTLIIGGFLLGFLPGLPVLLAGLSLIIARKLNIDFSNASGDELNPLLGRTAKLTIIFSALFSIGLLFT